MHLIKYMLALLLYYTGILHAVRVLFAWVAGKDALVVLLYHRVVESGQRNGSMPEMTVTPANFAAQMEHISRFYTPVSLDEFFGGRDKSSTTKRPRIMVTFDDGWHDNYLNAYPVLKRSRVPALIFLATSYIGGNRVFWPERLADALNRIFSGGAGPDASRKAKDLIHSLLESKPGNGRRPFLAAERPDVDEIKALISELKYFPSGDIEDLTTNLMALFREAPGVDEPERMTMDWDEAREMSGDGITFGSHTCTHILVDRASPREVEQELKTSKEIIEERLGAEVLSFAYPNGNYDRGSIEAVRNAGYRAAFTTRYGMNTPSTPLLELRRIRIDDKFSSSPLGGFSAGLFELGIWRHLLSSVAPSLNR